MMNKICNRLLFLMFYVIWSWQTMAQQRIDLSLTLPAGINLSKLIVMFDNGKYDESVSRENIIGRTLKISKTYFSKYAALSFYYNRNHARTFFLKGPKAIIKFNSQDSSKPNFDQYLLINSFDFKRDIDKLSKFHAKEREDFMSFMDINEEKVDKGDSIARSEWKERNNKLLEKDLEFIQTNGQSYYSWWLFKKSIIGSSIKSRQDLLNIFNSTFPSDIKDSQEGKFILAKLYSIINSLKGHTAPDFDAQDINGSHIMLRELLKRGNVLLVFGASWCVPCMQEIPDLKSIENLYPTGNLQIVYCTLDKIEKDFLKVIQAKNLDWINIPYNIDLINSYIGGNLSVPQVFLIDKTGKFLYSRMEESDVKLDKLKQLLESELGKKADISKSTK